MSMPALPGPNTGAWYTHYAALHNAAVEVVEGRLTEAALDDQIITTVAASASTTAETSSPITEALDLTYARIGTSGSGSLDADDSVKLTDTARSNTASLANDPHLALSLAPNKLTRFSGPLLIDSQASAADFKCDWVLPSGATMKWRLLGPGITVTGGAPGSTTGAAPAINNWEVLTESGVGKCGGMGVGTPIWVEVEGLVTTGDTGGEMRLRWAQNTADAAVTTLLAGSRLRRVSINDIVSTPDPPPVGSTNVVSLANGVDFNMNGARMRVQSPNKTYSFQAIIDPNTPLYTRHELRSGDVWTDGRQRCEARHFTAWPYSTDIWFSCAMRFTGSFPTGSYCDVIQWRQDMESGESGGKPPPFTLDVSGTGTEIRTRYDATATTTTQPAATARYNGAALAKNVWHDWVFKFRFNWTGAAQLSAWLNGTQIINLTGINMGYNDNAGPYIKWGQYRGGATETFVVEVANPEIGTSSLLARVATPLTHPTF